MGHSALRQLVRPAVLPRRAKAARTACEVADSDEFRLRAHLGDLTQLAQRAVGLQARQSAGQGAHGVLVLVVVLRGQRHLRSEATQS